MAYGYGSSRNVNPSGSQGYGYSTLTSSVNNPSGDVRACRSRTISSQAKGYSIFNISRPRIDRRYSPSASNPVTRHRAGTGPTPLLTMIPSALSCPKNVMDKSSPPPRREKHQPGTRADGSRRKSATTPRTSGAFEYRSKGQRKDSSRQNGTEKRPAFRYSFSSRRSSATARSTLSKTSSASKSRNGKPKSSNRGLWNCFGS